ncbi:MAG: hypothetical protein IKD77_05695 [Bacilli bacterium]|nr:hypothetical protein [Bacilli bacterium]
MKSKQKEEYITATGLIKKRGWTKNMVGKLTGNLEVKLVDNPHYKCASPMRLLLLKDIKRIERTKKFKELKEKAERRKPSAKKAVETKIKNTLGMADTFSIVVERIDLDTLIKNTLAAKQYWYDFNSNWNYMKFDYRDAYSAPKENVNRWMVNYIRHNLSNYDEELESLKGKIGKLQGYWYYKEKLANEMKKVYPELRKEIDYYMMGISDNMKEDN